MREGDLSQTQRGGEEVSEGFSNAHVWHGIQKHIKTLISLLTLFTTSLPYPAVFFICLYTYGPNVTGVTIRNSRKPLWCRRVGWEMAQRNFSMAILGFFLRPVSCKSIKICQT